MIDDYVKTDHARFRDITADSVVLKNNRIAHERPESGKTHGEDGRMSNISKGAIGESVADENPEQFNKNAILDLQEQRAKVIERQAKLEDDLRQKRLLEQKEKDRK